MTEPIPISALEHYRYCPRQCALIHMDGVWADNRHTVRGSRGHRRVDEGASRVERGRVVLRGLEVWSEKHGLVGRADVVEVHSDDVMVPVEYKIGVRHGDAADVQLCAQALCLEEMFGTGVVLGYVWYSTPRQRVPVRLDGALRELTFKSIADVRSMLGGRHLPSATFDRRCAQCQLAAACMPGIVSASGRVAEYWAEVVQCTS